MVQMIQERLNEKGYAYYYEMNLVGTGAWSEPIRVPSGGLRSVTYDLSTTGVGTIQTTLSPPDRVVNSNDVVWRDLAVDAVIDPAVTAVRARSVGNPGILLLRCN